MTKNEIATLSAPQKARNDSWTDCHCEERSDEAIDAFVIASLNAGGVQAWQSHNAVIARSEATKQSQKKLPRAPEGSLTMTQNRNQRLFL